MSVARDDILKAALSLPKQDRLAIAAELMDSVTEPPGLSIDDPGFLDELERRSNDGSPGIPWEQVKADLNTELEK
jgi:putative addiction module component (TIGR02574 family)